MFLWNSNFTIHETALIIAIKNEYIDIVKLLLENKQIDVNIKVIIKFPI